MIKIFIIALTTVVLCASDLSDKVNNLKEKMTNYQNYKIVDYKDRNISNLEESKKGLNPMIENYSSDILHQGGEEISSCSKQNKINQIDITKDSYDASKRIYLFMSTNIPKSIWYKYAEFLHENKIYNASMLLRGCIGGCEKIKPTLEFISDVVTMGGKYPNGMTTRVEIDPLLFRKYNIKEVPCVVYVENLQLKNVELSEGLEHNVNDNTKIFKSCGDWGMRHHFEELYEDTKSNFLKQFLKPF